jgi:hypothetical protein
VQLVIQIALGVGLGMVLGVVLLGTLPTVIDLTVFYGWRAVSSIRVRRGLAAILIGAVVCSLLATEMPRYYYGVAAADDLYVVFGAGALSALLAWIWIGSRRGSRSPR